MFHLVSVINSIVITQFQVRHDFLCTSFYDKRFFNLRDMHLYLYALLISSSNEEKYRNKTDVRIISI